MTALASCKHQDKRASYDRCWLRQRRLGTIAAMLALLVAQAGSWTEAWAQRRPQRPSQSRSQQQQQQQQRQRPQQQQPQRPQQQQPSNPRGPSQSGTDVQESQRERLRKGKVGTQDYDALYERIFGRRPQRIVQTMGLPVRMDNRIIGAVRGKVVQGYPHETEIHARELAALLAPVAHQTLIQNLSRAGSPEPFVPLAAVRAVGVVLVFDENEFLFEVDVPARFRDRRHLALRQENIPTAADALLSDNFSAFFNLRTGLTYQHVALRMNDEGFDPFQAQLQSVIQLYRWVLQTEITATEQPKDDLGKDMLRRGDILLTRDFPDQAVRLAMGELGHQPAGFQSTDNFVGIGIARNFSLQPYRIIAPAGDHSFMMREDGLLEVFVNRRLMYTEQLSAGPYDMSQFPLTPGTNDVAIRITDRLGNFEEVSFPFYFDPSLLDEGTHQFAYTLGLPRTLASNEKRAYDTKRPSGAFFHRFGATSQLTVGANAQGDQNQVMGGGELRWATGIGSFFFEGAGSRNESGDTGLALRGVYDFVSSGVAAWFRPRFNLQVVHRSRRFGLASAGQQPNNRTAFTVRGNYGQLLPYQITATLSGGASFRRDDLGTEWSGRFSLQRAMGPRISLNLGFQAQHDEDGTRYGATMFLTLLTPAHDQFVSVSADSLQRNGRVDWNMPADPHVGTVGASASLEGAQENATARGQISYVSPRFESSVTTVASKFHEDNGTGNTRVEARFASALVYSGGHFALSRPITGSFLLLAPRKNFRDQFVGVNPIGEDGYLADLGNTGAAVIPDMSPYQMRFINLSAPDLPVGYDLGKDAYAVLPSFRAGTAVVVGAAAVVIARAKALTPQGNIVTLQGGEVTSLSNPAWEPLNIFSNRKGRFFIPSLEAGSYQLVFHALPKLRIRFDIPEGATGMVHLGALQLEPYEPDSPTVPGKK